MIMSSELVIQEEPVKSLKLSFRGPNDSEDEGGSGFPTHKVPHVSGTC